MKRSLILIVMFLCLSASLHAVARLPVEYRCWQFQELDPPYVIDALGRAKDYDINTVIYSHRMIANVPHLFNEPVRARILMMLADEAHKYDLKVWLWLHELEGVPDQFLADGRIQIDKEGFWDWLAARYERLFTKCPVFDGIMLTFHETEYKIFRDSEVQSSLSIPERFARMINTIDDVCAKYDKDFVVRSFLYEPKELQWFSDGLKKVHSRVMLQAKCMPHDFSPHYPHNPIIGRYRRRKLIVEFSPSEGFYGASTMPFASPEYFEWRWRYDLAQPGVVGYNARLDQSVDALNNPQEIDLYTLYRMSEDSKITSKDIWDEWTRLRYNEKAAPYIEEALKVTREMSEKALYFKKFWVIRHSGIPDFFYASGHITSRSLVKWAQENPEYRKTEKKLLHPDPQFFEDLLREKDEAMALVHRSLGHLEKARPYLRDDQYIHLVRWMNIAERNIVLVRLWTEAFFGFKVLAEGHEVPGLKQRVERAVDALLLQAEASEIDPRPQSAGVLRRAALDIRIFLELPELPIAVYQTFVKELDREIGGFQFLDECDIDTKSVGGETIYVFKIEADNPERLFDLRIKEDGTLIKKR